MSKEEKLTYREQVVLGTLLDGADYESAAGKLNISALTIKTHVSNIFAKLDVHSLSELICKKYKEVIAQKDKEIERLKRLAR